MEKLRDVLNQINIDISDKQLEQFNIFYEMLIEKNKVMNLTAITEKDEVIIKHFADSVAVIPYIKKYNLLDSKNFSIIDIGTGAGFPGIPLKIMLPEINITLLDSLNKRINFINEVVDELELSNVNAIHGRAEDYANDKLYREKYDLCVSRAVANLSTLSEYCLPFVRKDGIFISYKAGDSEEEINNSKNAIKILGGKISKVESFTLPESDASRVFVIVEKHNNTEKKYPRKAGTPAKSPL